MAYRCISRTPALVQLIMQYRQTGKINSFPHPTFECSCLLTPSLDARATPIDALQILTQNPMGRCPAPCAFSVPLLCPTPHTRVRATTEHAANSARQRVSRARANLLRNPCARREREREYASGSVRAEQKRAGWTLNQQQQRQQQQKTHRKHTQQKQKKITTPHETEQTAQSKWCFSVLGNHPGFLGRDRHHHHHKRVCPRRRRRRRRRCGRMCVREISGDSYVLLFFYVRSFVRRFRPHLLWWWWSSSSL